MHMKKLLCLTLLLAGAFVANAQTTTNVIISITQEKVSGGTTNATTLSFSFDQGTKKGIARVDGLNFAHQSYANTFGTNAPSDNFKQWLKNEVITPIADNYSQQKQQADNAALLQKLTSLLTQNIDLLNASDISNLQAVAAKAP